MYIIKSLLHSSEHRNVISLHLHHAYLPPFILVRWHYAPQIWKYSTCLNIWMSIRLFPSFAFFFHDHEPRNYSVKGEAVVWLCHLWFGPFSSEQRDLPGLPCVRDVFWQWCRIWGLVRLAFFRLWSSAHAGVLHNWVGKLQDEVAAPSREKDGSWTPGWRRVLFQGLVGWCG